MAKAYVITGPSGIGKSTVSAQLAKKLKRCAVLEGDEVYNQIVGGKRPWEEGNHLDLMWKNSLGLMQNYLDNDIDVIFNYIIYDDNFDLIKKSLAKYELHFIVLVAEEKTVLNREGGRDADVQTHRGVGHLQKFKSCNIDKSFFLNTDDLNADEVADKILTGEFLVQTGVDENHFCGLQKPYFDKIKSGEKTIECRLYDEKRKQIKVGDDIVFGLEPERRECMRKRVKSMQIFESFNELCEHVLPAKTGFSNKQEMLIVYSTIYPKEKQKENGVVAIEIE